MKVLIVDDSRTMRMIVRKTLHSVGIETEEAGDGREALEVLEKAWPIDAALVDWNMPEMNGMEFLVTVRADSKYEALRVMMITTESEIEQVQRALEAGANEYLMKPFEREALIDKLMVLGIDVG